MRTARRAGPIFNQFRHHLDPEPVSGMAEPIQVATGRLGLSSERCDVVSIPVRHHRGHRAVEYLVALGRTHSARGLDRCRTGLVCYCRDPRTPRQTRPQRRAPYETATNETSGTSRSFGNRNLLDWPPEPVRLGCQRANTTTAAPAAANPERGRPHAAHRAPATVGTNPDPAASPGEGTTDPRNDADNAPGCAAAGRVRSCVRRETDRTSVAMFPTLSRAHTGPSTASAARRSPA